MKELIAFQGGEGLIREKARLTGPTKKSLEVGQTDQVSGI